jgi:hypothetical protein
LFGRERNMRSTRDDVPLGEQQPRDKQVGNIVYPEPVTRISLAKVWTAEAGDPLAEQLAEQANYATQVFVDAVLARDEQELDDESLKNAISHSKVLTATLQDIQAKKETADGLARARAKDAPRDPDPAGDRPPGEKQTKDALALAHQRNPAIPSSGGQYDANLKKERAAMAVRDQAAPVAPARVSGPEFAKLHDKSAAKRA